jgi:hypothetical protein
MWCLPSVSSGHMMPATRQWSQTCHCAPVTYRTCAGVPSCCAEVSESFYQPTSPPSLSTPLSPLPFVSVVRLPGGWPLRSDTHTHIMHVSWSIGVEAQARVGVDASGLADTHTHHTWPPGQVVTGTQTRAHHEAWPRPAQPGLRAAQQVCAFVGVCVFPPRAPSARAWVSVPQPPGAGLPQTCVVCPACCPLLSCVGCGRASTHRHCLVFIYAPWLASSATPRRLAVCTHMCTRRVHTHMACHPARGCALLPCWRGCSWLSLVISYVRASEGAVLRHGCMQYASRGVRAWRARPTDRVRASMHTRVCMRMCVCVCAAHRCVRARMLLPTLAQSGLQYGYAL